MISPHYNLWLVGLSLLVTLAGCYAGLSLATRFGDRDAKGVRSLITSIALILGATTWAAHFISMLALEFPFAVSYDAQLTLVSALVSVLVIGVGLYVGRAYRDTRFGILAGGAVLGCGFSIMHFIGIAAFQSNSCFIVFETRWILLSVLFSIGVATLSLWLAFKNHFRGQVFLGAAVLTISICSMHYFAMLASRFVQGDVQVTLDAPALPPDILALVTSLVVFGIIGAALLVAIPYPGDKTAAKRDRAVSSTTTTGEALPQMGQQPSTAPPSKRLPVERENRTIYLDLSDILYIKADSHYSQVFDGADTYFCNSSLSDLEKRLPADNFSRIHRSFIVNMRRVKGLKEDHAHGGRLLFDRDGVESVPVSRRRLKEMQTLLSV